VGHFDGKVAIVTGAGRGIGREHALALARAGASVVVNDLGATLAGEGADATPAQQVVAEIESLGARAVANGANVADWDESEAMVRQAVDELGGLHILVNNAGITRDRMLVNMTEDEWDDVIAVHLKGHFAPTRHAAAYWRERVKAGEEVRGRVINTPSPSGVFGNVGQTNYGAAKAGLIGLSNVLAVEGARNNILSNVIMPVAYTRMTEELLGDAGQLLTAESVTPMVTYLCSEANTTTHGAFSAAGGRYAKVFTGLAQGWFAGKGATVTAEDIQAHYDEITKEEGYIVPQSTQDEIMTLLGLFA